ncbi:hypothetical protein DRJ25_04640 [Candidatus Woesearchaeota archaeon]|nr:MAG: hypothetical protein DRJ25_04640 [Candidatus Woesearchaeota archaeon]
MASGMNNSREKVLNIIKSKGPLLPAAVAKEINTNILFASAILAELVSSKIVKITYLKVGGSPLYYVPGQQYKLVNYKDKLNEKDRKTFDILKEKKILRDSEVSPLMRVSLRNIKDFAVPLEVTLDASIDIFWKWYLLSNEDAEALIKEQLFPKEKEESKEEVEIAKAKQEVVDSTLTEKEKSLQAEIVSEQKDKKQDQVQRTLVDEKGEKTEKELKEEAEKQKEEVLAPQAEPKPEPKSDDAMKKSEEVNQDFGDIQDSFFNKVRKYFDENDIVIKDINIIKKNSDIEFEVRVPTAIGGLDFYCRAKSKKRPNDSDLATAYVQGEVKKLPVLFLSVGDLTKKAKEMLGKEFKRIKAAKI